MSKENKQQKAFRPVNAPSVLQMEAVECGAASLTMILGYYKKYLPLSEVRAACGVSRDGSKASNVVRAAEKYGLTADGYKKSPEELKYIKPPMILHWNFNHFLVLEGIKGDKVYLNDPAEGKRVVTKEELDKAFTGIVLTFEPNKDFQPGGKPRTILDSMIKRLVGIRLGISYAFLAGLGLIIPGLAIPAMTQLFIDRVLIGKSQTWVMPIIAGLVFMALLKNFFSNTRAKYMSRLNKKIVVANNSKMFWHVLRLPMSFFFQRFAADVGSRMDISEHLSAVLSGGLADAALDLFSVFFYLLLMLQYSYILTIIGILFGVGNLLFLRYLSGLEEMNSRNVLQEGGKLAGVSISGIKMIESIKSGGGENGFFEKWAGHHAKLLGYEQEASVNSIYMSAAPSVLNALNGIAILSIGSLQVLNGSMTIGSLIGFQAVIGSFMGPFNSIVSFATSLTSLKGQFDRVDDVLDSKLDPMISATELNENDVNKSKLEGYIELKKVTFGYSPLDPPLIENFDLKLSPGSRVALVGMSGSGKSTVTKVVSGLYKEWSGEIFFDGVNRKNLPKELINNSLAVIDQEVISFKGTIRDNLKLWDNTITDEEMIQACKDADIYEDIISRKEGFDYDLKEGASGFSGGQLQRLEIARVLATSPSIIVMDEATSALDTTTEKFVDESIRRRGCTAIIVAHRLSTIRDSDEIIVLNKGKVEQRGTHEELKEQEGLYATLINSM